VTVRLRDRVDLLEPNGTIEGYRETLQPDWSKPPKRELLCVPFYARPLASTEEALIADTIVELWRGFLPPTIPNPDNPSVHLVLQQLLTPQWRIRWDHEIYRIDGMIERHKTGTRTRFHTMKLKRIDG